MPEMKSGKISGLDGAQDSIFRHFFCLRQIPPMLETNKGSCAPSRPLTSPLLGSSIGVVVCNLPFLEACPD